MSFQHVNGYPRKTVNKDGKRVIDKVWAPWAEALTAEATYPVCSECDLDASLTLEGLDIEPFQGQKNGLVTLTYIPRESNVNIDSKQIESSADSMGSQEPLYSHDSYKLKWDHRLIKEVGAIDYTGTEDTTDSLPNVTYQKNKWIAFDESVPDGWVTQQAPTKPGKRTYVIPNPIIHEVQYFSDPKKAGACMLHVGKIKSPKQKYGLPAGSFLLVGVSISREGKKWVVRSDYQWDVNGWDTDIYGAA